MTWVERGTAVFDFIDRRYITRRLMTIGTFVVVLKVIFWSLDYATTSPRTGTEIGVILAAIMVPLNALMGYMFNQYVQGSGGEGKDAIQPMRNLTTPPAQVIVNNQAPPS